MIEPQPSVISVSEPEEILVVEQSISMDDQEMADQAGPSTSQVPDLTLVIVKYFPRIESPSPDFDISDGIHWTKFSAV